MHRRFNLFRSTPSARVRNLNRVRRFFAGNEGWREGSGKGFRKRVLSVILLGSALIASASASTQTPGHPLQSDPLHLEWINKTLTPSQDFYGFANGRWQEKNPIPDRYSSWDNFHILQEQMETKLNQMMAGLAQNPALKSGTVSQQIGDFYWSGMNQAAINDAGFSPLKSVLAEIDALKTTQNLEALLPKIQLMGVNALFAFGSQQDFKNSQQMIAAAMQGGLGLPDRDYYCSADEKFVRIRALYQQHISRVFQLLGATKPQAEKEAATVMRLETALAQASYTQIKQRDPYAIYHKMPVKELNTLTPHFSWPAYLKRLDLNFVDEMNIGMPQFFKALDQLLVNTPMNDWKVYLRWQVLDSFAAYLSEPFVSEEFRFSQALFGAKELRPRWQRVVNTVNHALAFAVGQYYIEHHFSQANKQQVQEMMQGIRQTFRQVLSAQPWMMPETKKAALLKLEQMTQRVGYPDKWRDYRGLVIDRGPYVLNVIRANEFNNRYDLSKIGKPVDKDEWSMSPQTINAYYDPSMNSINILAGILQAPFFDPEAPAAVNYGSIGFVIGHEMTHGFDDQGALFDGLGNLKNWWTPQDMKQFKAATQCIAKQFSGYKVLGTIPLQGQLVVGEATADLGGVLLAYQAFHASKDYLNAKKIDGYTPDQQFFLGVAHVWAGNMRPELAQQLVTVDPHPPMQYRVNGTVANLPAFRQAFGIRPPSPMIQEPVCRIW